jgi:hypothetical protein
MTEKGSRYIDFLVRVFGMNLAGTGMWGSAFRSSPRALAGCEAPRRNPDEAPLPDRQMLGRMVPDSRVAVLVGFARGFGVP